jgi:very-short-patch-repair endonuclease
MHVDFAFPGSKLAVECDGYRYHHDRKERDAARDSCLRRNGWTVLRFSGDRIRADVRGCVREISERL